VHAGVSPDVTTFGGQAMLAWVAQLWATYGYGAVAFVVMGESLGLPLPGETLLLLGAASAGAG
jgi:membrane protein DedA with SNARE-associated domain